MKFTKLDVNETMQAEQGLPGVPAAGQPRRQQPQENPTTPPAPQTNSAMDNILTALRDILGFEIGSINVPDPNNPGIP